MKNMKSKIPKWTIVENRVEQWETEYTVKELGISGIGMKRLTYALADEVESLREELKKPRIDVDWKDAPSGCRGVTWQYVYTTQEEEPDGYDGYISKPLPPPVRKSILALGNEYCKKIAKDDDLYSAFLILHDNLGKGKSIEELCTSIGISLFVEEK